MTATSYVFPAAIPRPPSARAPPGAPRLSAAPAARDFTNARRPNLRGEAANVSIDHSMTQSHNHSMTQWSNGSMTQSPDCSVPEVLTGVRGEAPQAGRAAPGLAWGL